VPAFDPPPQHAYGIVIQAVFFCHVLPMVLSVELSCVALSSVFNDDNDDDDDDDDDDDNIDDDDDDDEDDDVDDGLWYGESHF
jgi:hypothetical protein